MEIQKEMYSSSQVRELQRLSDTRWACRYTACKAVRDRLPALMQLLSDLAVGCNAKRAVEAKALLNALDCQFVLMLLFMCEVLGQTQSLSVMLQSTEINFSGVIDLLDVICTSLAECRSQDEHFCKLWSDALNLCALCGIEFTVYDSSDVATAALPPRKRQLPAKFADSHVMQTVGDRPRTDSRDGFRQTVYFPVLDKFLCELQHRFSASQCDALRGIEALTPCSDNFADFICVQPFAELYQADLSDLSHELHQAKRLLERMNDSDRPTTLVRFVSHIEQFKAAFPELYRLGVIAICLPVSTALCEHSFSALRHIKTWVRNSMSHEKLDSVSILAIERERAQSLDNDKVIDTFAAVHRNRHIKLN